MLEHDSERRTREQLAEYKLGYACSRSWLPKDGEVTRRFREVLGTHGPETFKKCAYAHSFSPAIFLIILVGRRAQVQRGSDAPRRAVGVAWARGTPAG